MLNSAGDMYHRAARSALSRRWRFFLTVLAFNLLGDGRAMRWTRRLRFQPAAGG